MTTEMLDWVLAYLERDEEIVVPVKKMWNEWNAAHGRPALEDFTAALLSDERIEDTGGVDHDEDREGMTPAERADYEQEMEAEGFFSGPRVKLKAREITLEHVARMIGRHSGRMVAALNDARAAMPADMDEREEGQLIDVIALAEKLRAHLREAGLVLDEEEGGADAAE